MAETAVEETPEETPVETPEETPVETPVEAPDWRTGIESDDLRKHSEQFQSMDQLAQAHLDQRKLLSTAIQPLRANAKDEDRAAFRKAVGGPERIDDYIIPDIEGVDPEFIKSDAVAARLKGFADIAFAGNVSNDTFGKLVAQYFTENNNDIASLQAEDDVFAEESRVALQTEWGTNFAKESEFANRGAEWAAEGGLDDFRSLKTAEDRLVADHPVMVKMLNKIGRAISEDSVGTFPMDAEAQSDLRAQIATLTGEQEDARMRGEHDKASSIDRKIFALAEKMGDGPIVGAT